MSVLLSYDDNQNGIGYIEQQELQDELQRQTQKKQQRPQQAPQTMITCLRFEPEILTFGATKSLHTSSTANAPPTATDRASGFADKEDSDYGGQLTVTSSMTRKRKRGVKAQNADQTKILPADVGGTRLGDLPVSTDYQSLLEIRSTAPNSNG